MTNERQMEIGSFAAEEDTLRRRLLSLEAELMRLKPQAEASLRFEAGIPDAAPVSGLLTHLQEIIDEVESLRRSEERLRLFLDNFQGTAYQAEVNSFRPLLLHGAIEDISGWPVEDFLSGRVAWNDLIDPEDLPKLIEQGQANLKEPGSYNDTEYRLLRRDGSVRWVRDISRVVVLPDGRTVMQGTAYDITERKRAERLLAESEARWQFAVEGVGYGVWDWNIEADETYYSPKWKELLGFAESEIGRSPDEWSERIHPEDIVRVRAAVDEHLAGRAPVYVSEYRVRCKDGSYKWILGRGKVVSRAGDGRALRMIGTHTDITERRQAEERRLEMERRLLQKQKLESLGQLAGGVAHDFNNLLTVILGNIELAQFDLPEGSSVRALLDAAADAGTRAGDLTRQMLAYSGKGRFVIGEIDLSRFIEEHASLIGASITKTAALSFKLEPDLPRIEGDRGQLEQVIFNLVANASEAIGDQAGVITITTGLTVCDDAYLSCSHVEEKPQVGEFVYIDISDTGCGMTQEIREQMFDPFFSTKFTGRGLGLPAVLGILRGHHGAIMVGSEPGAGTTIRVLFPVGAAQQLFAGEKPKPEGADLPKPKPLRRRPKFLLVDDEELVRDLGRTMIEHLGYDVETASDGREAVSIFERRADEFDGVVLDLSMPNMNGFAAFNEIRRCRPNTRVILSSGYTEQEATQQFIGRGLSAFLQKPYDLQSLKNTLSDVLESC